MKNCRGFVLPLAIVIILPLSALTALVVDAGRSWFYRQVMQQAADAAVLAAAARLSEPDTVEDWIEEVFRINAGAAVPPVLLEPSVDYDLSRVTLSVTLLSPVSFAGVFDMEEMTVGVKSTARRTGSAFPYSYRLAPDF